MKRVKAIKMLMGGGTDDVVIRIDQCDWSAVELIQLYDYLDEELPEYPETDQKEPETDQKEVKSVQKEVKPVRKRIDSGKVIALYKAGWKQKDIAEEIGCCESVISMCLKKARADGKI